MEREAYVTAAGWTMLRFGAYLIIRHPDLVAARVRTTLRHDPTRSSAGQPRTVSPTRWNSFRSE
ncbi:hypothetical protein GCM10023320_78720 [Pseudonocardia adelaidensis]|uniref:Cytochrome P450 n=1 Tax=Pseudonocardia adelaidensis TaxID=648754 RepID=A0ABP9P5R3_9PSEU